MRIARTEVLSVEATGERCDIERITHRSVEGRWKRIGEDTSLAAYPTPKGFHILPRRWVVERTNAWITHNRRLSRDFEGTHTSSEAFIYLAMTKLMLSRLVRFRL